MSVKTRRQARERRRRRVRAKVRGSAERPRISIFRSNRGISAQVVDDDSGKTLASVSWREKEFQDQTPLEQSKRAGGALAERAKQAGVEVVVYDRGGYRYHGNVQAFAEGLREGGITL